MNLKELEQLGVRELSVSNGQAVAVNPYEPQDSRQKEGKVDTWRTNAKYFEVHNLPPLPCHESVKEGTYPIGRFSEEKEYEINGDGAWISERFIDVPHLLGTVWTDRIILVLSEPVAESEDNNLSKSDMEIKDFTKQGEENGRKLIKEIFKGGVKNLDECAKIALISTDLIIKETLEEYTNDENHDRVEHHRDIKKFLQWFIALKPLSELNPNS